MAKASHIRDPGHAEVWEHLGVHPEELEQVPWERESGCPCSYDPVPEKEKKMERMDAACMDA